MNEPFIYHKPVSGAAFAGRSAEARGLANMLSSGENVVVYEPPKSGKHSLMMQATFIANQKGTPFCTAEVDMSAIRSSKDFACALGSAAVNACCTGPGECAEAVRTLLDGTRLVFDPVQYSAGAASVSASWDLGEEDFAALLGLPYRLSEMKGRRIVVILDEFQNIMHFDDADMMLRLAERVLKDEADYRTCYYYGGDADFTNMRSYLKSSGFERIVCDKDFPVSQRLSKWGAHDHLVFDRLLDDMKQEDTLSAGRQPRFRVLQTSSSHEPFEVPYRRLADDRLNAFAYTDSCVGDFIQRFRQLPQWHNTLVVLVPDHLGAYPENLSTLSVERYQVPLLLVGGAVAGPKRVDVYGSQQDIAATLLAQMGLPHGEFTFSKDLMNPAAPHFGFFTVPDAFGMVTEDNRVVFDCQSGKVSLDEGTAQGRNLPLGKAYLQKLYDDVAAR